MPRRARLRRTAGRARMDKSHITVHTYPETHPQHGIATFRADIDVATCGVISPLKALNYLIESLESDIVVMDYRVRGFTRDIKGKKHYIDHRINSIQEFLAKNIRSRYEMFDVNVYQENIFHTKMHLKDFDLDNYLFEEKAKNLSFKDRMPPGRGRCRPGPSLARARSRTRTPARVRRVSRRSARWRPWRTASRRRRSCPSATRSGSRCSTPKATASSVRSSNVSNDSPPLERFRNAAMVSGARVPATGGLPGLPARG